MAIEYGIIKRKNKTFYPITKAELVTLSFSTNSVDTEISRINEQLASLMVTKHFKGFFASVSALQSAVQSPEEGDYAIIKNANGKDYFAIWDSGAGTPSGTGAWIEFKASDQNLVSINGMPAIGEIEISPSNIPYGIDGLGNIVYLSGKLEDIDSQISGIESSLLNKAEYKGDWENNVAYNPNDIVKHNHHLYIQVANSSATGVEPLPLNSSTWESMAIDDGALPTKTSDLTNDGDDGTSAFATESYVDTYGGKIDTISVNGTNQTITNKSVDITVPTQTSDLTNNGDGFQEHSGYDQFNLTSDYVDYYVLEGSTYTKVTSDNKDTLNITPGTTKAYDEYSPFATESYVDTNGGKIDVIKVNGSALTIINKEVDIAIAKTGGSAPTTSTVADFLGQFYLLVDISNSENNATYQCVAITTANNTTTYTWVEMMRRVNVTELE